MTKCAELLNRTIDVDFVDINVGCPIDLVYKKVRSSVVGFPSLNPCPHPLLPDCSFQSDPELSVHLWAHEKGNKLLKEQGMAVSAWWDLGGKSTLENFWLKDPFSPNSEMLQGLSTV